MARLNNKGFSLVEVIVAVAIFAILIVPLTTQLISAVNTNKMTTKKQYAVEMAEAVMESFKMCDLNGDPKVVSDGREYTFTRGTSTPGTISLPDGASADYTTDTYTCNNVSIGTNFETYTCTVEVDNAAYAVASKGYVYDGNGSVKTKNGSPVKINTSTGTTRNLDNNQSAIIAGSTYAGAGSAAAQKNLDNDAYNYFHEKKVNLLSNYDTYYNQYLNGNDFFSNDIFSKYTTIKISETVGGKYEVECTVKYVDSTGVGLIASSYHDNVQNVYRPSTSYGADSGIVYKKEFDNEVPIYLLYVPAICNGKYVDNDYIRIDNSAAPSVEPKIYIFETAADIDASNVYKQIIESNLGVDDVNKLIYSSSTHTNTYRNVNVLVDLESGDADSLKVYSNFSVSPASGIHVKSLAEDENDDIYMYGIKVTLTDSKGHKTEITGTRGE